MSRCLGLLLCLCALPTAARSAREAWTLVGTTVDAWGAEPARDVRVTLFPDSLVTVSDDDGDFVLPWNGERGWLTFVASTPGLDGKPWCKRVVLHAATNTEAGPIRDFGMIRVTPRARLAYGTTPSPPSDRRRPAVLRLPPPREGEPDTCRFRVAFQADLWGKIHNLRLVEDNGAPAALRDSVLDWYRRFDWVVPAETTCEPELPFSGDDDVHYAWADSAWMLLDRGQVHRERVRRQRAAGSAEPRPR